MPNRYRMSTIILHSRREISLIRRVSFLDADISTSLFANVLTRMPRIMLSFADIVSMYIFQLKSDVMCMPKSFSHFDASKEVIYGIFYACLRITTKVQNIKFFYIQPQKPIYRPICQCINTLLDRNCTLYLLQPR